MEINFVAVLDKPEHDSVPVAVLVNMDILRQHHMVSKSIAFTIIFRKRVFTREG